MLRLKRRGWREIMFQGRKAIERYICMDCLNHNYIADAIHAEYQQTARRLEKPASSEQNFYHVLCEVEGE